MSSETFQETIERARVAARRVSQELDIVRILDKHSTPARSNLDVVEKQLVVLFEQMAGVHEQAQRLWGVDPILDSSPLFAEQEQTIEELRDEISATRNGRPPTYPWVALSSINGSVVDRFETESDALKYVKGSNLKVEHRPEPAAFGDFPIKIQWGIAVYDSDGIFTSVEKFTDEADARERLDEAYSPSHVVCRQSDKHPWVVA